MKLYATVTSERASKGQGGNDYLEIELKAFDRLHPIGYLLMSVHEDAEGHKDQYLLTFKRDDDDEPIILLEGHQFEGEIQSIYDALKRSETKGNKQKDESDSETCKQCKTIYPVEAGNCPNCN